MIVPMENIEKTQKSTILPVAICHENQRFHNKSLPFSIFLFSFRTLLNKTKELQYVLHYSIIRALFNRKSKTDFDFQIFFIFCFDSRIFKRPSPSEKF